ncbi:PAS domain-containing protein [Haloarchaeobius sp. DFWS5]|uniref:PAS domain-containing protein n=1 Tax=Haloarchaeobius sp. DFWS5 TaxID=3446114 RepID=UPI003EB9207F
MSLHSLICSMADGGTFLGRQPADPIRVLHVDDESAFGDLVTAYLTEADSEFEVVTESSAKAGLDYLDTAPVDCIVSDYQMPEMDGLEFLVAVREQYPDMPFILFTGKGSEAVAGKAIERGVTNYLQKRGGSEQYTILANRIENAVARNRAEKHAKRSLRALETATEGIAILDETKHFIYVNDAFERLYGYERGSLVGESFCILEGDNRTVNDQLEALRTQHDDTDRWRGVVTHVGEGGTPVEVELTATYSEPEQSFVCTVHERTDAARLQSELSLKERAMDAAPIGIVITDSNQQDNPILYANDGFSRLTGYDRDTVVGRNCRFLQGEDTDTETVDALRTAIAEERSLTVDLLNYRVDKTPFWNRVSVAPVCDDGVVTHYVGFQQDVSELKLAQQQQKD